MFNNHKTCSFILYDDNIIGTLENSFTIWEYYVINSIVCKSYLNLKKKKLNRKS